MIEKIKLIAIGVCIGIVICLIGYILTPSENNNLSVKELKKDQKENEKELIDSLKKRGIRSLADSTESRARRRFN